MSSEAPIGIGAGVRTLALISCVKDKLPYPAPAVEIYRGFSLEFALRPESRTGCHLYSLGEVRALGSGGSCRAV